MKAATVAGFKNRKSVFLTTDQKVSGLNPDGVTNLNAL
jgi:hypothetical protein